MAGSYKLAGILVPLSHVMLSYAGFVVDMCVC